MENLSKFEVFHAKTKEIFRILPRILLGLPGGPQNPQFWVPRGAPTYDPPKKRHFVFFFVLNHRTPGGQIFSGFWAPRKQDSWNGFWGCPQSKQTASKQSEQRKQSKQAIKAKQASKASKQSKQSKASKQSKQSEASNASKANKQSKQSKQPKQSKRAKHASKASKATETNGSQRKPAETNGSARKIGALGGRTGGGRCFSHSLLTPARGVGGCPGRKCLRSQFPVAPGKYWE